MKNLLFVFVLLLACFTESAAQFWAKSNGRFGIGDQDAFAKLQVNATSSFSNPGIALLDSSVNNTSGGILQFRSINYDDNHFNIQAKIGEFAYGQDSKLDFFWRDNLIMSIEGGTNPDRQLIYNPRDGIFRTGYLNPGTRGEYSVAMGYNNIASGYGSVALGGGAQATGNYSTVLGGGSTAAGVFSTAIGYDNFANAPYTLAAGRQSSAAEVTAVAIGDSTVATGAASHAIGYKTFASAHSSTATGHQTDATGLYSFSGGYYTQATNTSSTSFGFYSQATGVSATSLGYATLAAGENSIALNSVTKAFGNNALSAGYATNAYGWESSAFGNNTTTRSYVSSVFGAYNDTIATSVPDTWVSTDPLLMVGNGVSNAERNNAFTIYKNGNILARNRTIVTTPGVVPVPVEGAGTRLMWLAEKGAFRAGSVEGNEWDADSIGTHSFAIGKNTKATNFFSTATGYGTRAYGNGSTAMGLYSTGVGTASVGIGHNSWGIGDYAVALGFVNSAYGYSSTAIGHHSVSRGNYSTAMGYYTFAKSAYSTAFGSYNDEIGSSDEDTWVPTDPLFIIGNGGDDFSRHNALTIYKNGNLLAKNPTTVSIDPFTLPVPVSGEGTRLMWLPQKSAFRAGSVQGDEWDELNIGTWSFATGKYTEASGSISTALGNTTTASGGSSTAMGSFTTASGSISTAFGKSTIASALHSTAFGSNTIASGEGATSMGYSTEASGLYSTAMGYNTNATTAYSIATGSSTTASGQSSTAMGRTTLASGEASTAMGYGSEAMGYVSTAIGNAAIAPAEFSTSIGYYTIAKARNSIAIGAYNDTIAGSSELSWVETDPLFYIGNGSFYNDLSNAMVVYKNGNTDINGYTRLGEVAESAPRIKMKELPITFTGVNYNSSISIPHGVTAAKILSVSVLVEWDPDLFAPPEYSPSLNLRYNYYVNSTSIVIQNNTPSGDCLICEKVARVTITYKE